MTVKLFYLLKLQNSNCALVTMITVCYSSTSRSRTNRVMPKIRRRRRHGAPSSRSFWSKAKDSWPWMTTATLILTSSFAWETNAIRARYEVSQLTVSQIFTVHSSVCSEAYSNTLYPFIIPIDNLDLNLNLSMQLNRPSYVSPLQWKHWNYCPATIYQKIPGATVMSL